MNRELIIDSRASEVDIVLLEDKLLVELHKEKTNNNYAVGDVYLGKVKKIMPGLNAAFVDVGYEKDAFLHYLDLGPQIKSLNKYVKLALSGKPEAVSMENFRIETDIEKTGKITQVLASGAQILVQIAKEPISTKGPRISSEISFAGRYLVLVPFSTRISVSQKIRSSEERNRLKRLIQSIKPNNYGVIIRTVAENKKVAELDADLRNLVEKWEKTTAKLINAKAPVKIMSELDRTSAILRDLLNESFNNVHVNDPSLYEEIKSFIQTIAPQKADIVKLYKGKAPIFEYFGVDKQIKGLFGKTVTIRSGVYLIIEHTEAMHVIDVNSGHRVNKENSQEENALEVNLEAAAEIARQLRLRDMGGIIVIDFIDMHDSKHRRELYQKLKDEMARDHAKHTILPPSKFGLVQITRQRVRPEMNVEILERCPVCDGSGKIKPSILFIDEIENNLKYLLQDQNEKGVTLAVHPYMHAYLTKGLISRSIKWMWKYRKIFKINAMKNYHMLDYKFFNQNNDELTI
ncbi:MAG: Rne/Rng family ribonuclease [Bacteroidales bacterium]|nr:Rne/Rng family ribonuclease [Bacteroidales bacterium]MDP2235749.1 Rne/Rng family ribonuclease [Bacteroidales bacterium]